jgi:UDP-N-acetyl-D-glucosamine dehydrogenase
MNIAVVGMGKIGLPLAVQYAKKGNTVIGIDINPKTIELINQGLEPFPEEAHLKEYLADVVSRGLLKATLDYAEGVKNADVVVVVVPLFVNDKAEPEFSAMDQATALIGSNLKKGSLICYETTLPIGTTRTRFVPLLEKQSGLKAGTDFNVVFSPERVFTGRIFEDLRRYPKIVGGITQDCTNKGVNFYSQVLDFDLRDDLTKPNGVWAVESAESAEFVKLAETTYRDVNIALANQFAMYADKIGVNVYEVIESSNSQKFSHIHEPGISVGGHCIPIYPQFYLWSDPEASIVRKARETNSQMPRYFVNEILKSFDTFKNLKVLILGISYRANVKEIAFSGAVELKNILVDSGAKVFALDPFYTKSEINEIGFEYEEDLSKGFDAVILHTNHREFSEIDFKKFSKGTKLLDGRNFYSKEKVPSGIDYFKFGNLTKGKY